MSLFIFPIYVCPSLCLNYRILTISLRIYKCFHEYVSIHRSLHCSSAAACAFPQYCVEIQLSLTLFSTSSPKAPSAPSFIHFSELTTTSVNVSWGEPKQANGIIEGYRLVYEPCTPVDGEKLCLEPNNSSVSWHSSAGFCRQWFTTSCLVSLFFFNSRCLSSRSNLLQMGTGPAVALVAWLIIKYVGMLWWDFAAPSLTERNMANSCVFAGTGLSSNWEQTWNGELRLLRSLGCPLIEPE